LQWD
jgi:hypothetical protein